MASAVATCSACGNMKDGQGQEGGILQEGQDIIQIQNKYSSIIKQK